MDIWCVISSILFVIFLSLVLNNYLGYHLYLNGKKYKTISIELTSIGNYFAILNALIIIVDAIMSLFCTPPLKFLSIIISFILISILLLRICNKSNGWFERTKLKMRIDEKLSKDATKLDKRKQHINIDKEMQQYIIWTFYIGFFILMVGFMIFSWVFLNS